MDPVNENVETTETAKSEELIETAEQTSTAASVETEGVTPAQTEEKTDNSALLVKKYRIVLGLIGVMVIAGIVILNFAFRNAVALQKAEYEASKALYDKAYEEVIGAQDNWKQELSDKQNALNKAYAELEEIYAQRQAEIDAEEARWNALSEAEKEAEQKCNLYNEMVSYLRANNSEYAKIYVEYSRYLDKNIFEIGSAEALAYTELYEKKINIEKQYMLENGLIDEPGEN